MAILALDGFIHYLMSALKMFMFAQNFNTLLMMQSLRGKFQRTTTIFTFMMNELLPLKFRFAVSSFYMLSNSSIVKTCLILLITL